MRLYSQLRPPDSGRPHRRPLPLLRWVRSRSRWEKELFIKAVFAIVTAAIAIYAVSLLANGIHAAMQDIGH